AEFRRSGIAVAACGASARQRRAALRAELCRLRHAGIATRAIHRCIQEDRGPIQAATPARLSQADLRGRISLRNCAAHPDYAPKSKRWEVTRAARPAFDGKVID